jgi:hypothetical protein
MHCKGARNKIAFPNHCIWYRLPHLGVSTGFILGQFEGTPQALSEISGPVSTLQRCPANNQICPMQPIKSWDHLFRPYQIIQYSFILLLIAWKDTGHDSSAQSKGSTQPCHDLYEVSNLTWMGQNHTDRLCGQAGRFLVCRLLQACFCTFSRGDVPCITQLVFQG